MPKEATSTASGIYAPSLPRIRAVDLSQFVIIRRIAKIAFAAMLCSAGIFGIISNSTYISSSDAVVSADVVDIRAPIEGTMTGFPFSEGSFVHVGQLLGTLNNPRSDRQHLDNLLAVESSSDSMIKALTSERSALQLQKSDLLDRSRKDSSAVSSRLGQQATAAARTMAALEQANIEASVELDRGERLHDAGIIADAALDKLRSNQKIAAESVEAQRYVLASLRAESADAIRGILAEPGDASDVSYSRQRSDEIAIKLVDNATALAVAQGQSAQARVDAEAETLRESLMRKAEIRAPIQGNLWRLNVAEGEEVPSGASVLSLVNCNRQFLLVQVPQDRVPDVALHREARVRLAGESKELVGIVESVSGNVLKVSNARLAALPVQDSSEQMATVLVKLRPTANRGLEDTAAGSLEPNVGACFVGRTARVLVPTYSSSSNFVSRWIHEIF
ncbi:MAG: HlyD family efflux transporter periplasmic adaptor subunit [Acidobacteria bacterium]|nr:HlyD family efflux transporter periplasmic adaptor subunit [Acidobacteriota bacterium]